MFQYGGGARVLPDEHDRIAYHGIQGNIGVGFEIIVVQEVHIVADLLACGNETELVVGFYERLGAIEQILVDRQTVHGEFLHGIAILMDDFHLLDNRRLATFSGTWRKIGPAR